MRHGFAAAAALALGTLGLASCGEAEAPVVENPDMPAGIAVTNGRLSLPPVAGNPAAIYFDIANSGERTWVARAVEVQGAQRAVFHQMGTWEGRPSMDELGQIPVRPGETVTLEPGGMHVMAYDLADTLAAGGTTEVTLTFVGGDKASFPVEIRAAGEDR